MPSQPHHPTPYWDPFIDEMRVLNYEIGRNLLIRYAGADAKPERLPALAAELVNAGMDVIVTTGPRETRAAKTATVSIPIVMSLVPDPVDEGRGEPGAPRRECHGVVDGSPGTLSQVRRAAQRSRASRETARVLGVTLTIRRVSGPTDFESALAEVKRTRMSGIIVTPDVMTLSHSRQFVSVALKHRLPGIYWSRQYVDDGGLMSYSPDYLELRRRAAYYVDKILKGTRPGNLPVEQPKKFELVINLKTAKALGLTIPPSLLARADQVIE
ncbi:MAG TPA: ABC transporter substrate-binding protein [Gaiellales bacterium]|nr:ABC transporter substrate-binding protein [Gaiellales bacterium]